MKWLLPFALVLTSCADEREWQGWVYPDAENDAVGVSLAGFRTFEQCQEAAVGVLNNLPQPEKATYECGRQCRWDATYRANICKETRD